MVRVLNSAGEEIESIVATRRSENIDSVESLYEQARRKVLKVDESLDEVLKMLAER